MQSVLVRMTLPVHAAVAMPLVSLYGLKNF